MAWKLKRTTTETFDVNVAALDPMYMAGLTEPLDRILGKGQGIMAKQAEEWIICQFDLHDGSLYGDKLFSSRADQDTGFELIYEEDE